MDTLLVKIFATALTLSQVTTTPDAVKTHFDPATDRQQVVHLLRDGCQHMRKAFDIEDINLDDLLTTAMDDPQALTGDIKVLRGLKFGDLYKAYKQFCKDEPLDPPVVDLDQVIDYSNRALADLPDQDKLKSLLVLPGMTSVLDRNGKPYAEINAPEARRIPVPLAAIPKVVQQAFIAAEDKRFYQHKGIDERALVRAFIGNLADPGRPQGGSTITQQLAKNLITGDDLTYERKIREMVLASRIERTLSKDQILALYLNMPYLGRGAWGVEMAARAYYGKPARDLTMAEGALLAGLTKGPNYFSPERHPQRARLRYAYVLARMKEEGFIDDQAAKQALKALPATVPYERPRRDSGFHFVDQVAREAKTVAGIGSLTGAAYSIRTSIDPALQRAAEKALQDGLARYERGSGRARFAGPELNLGKAIAQRERKGRAPGSTEQPLWQQALQEARLPLYDVHWTPAVVLDVGRRGTRVGLGDGREVPLSTAHVALAQKLSRYDVVYVELTGANDPARTRAHLRSRPSVQGAVLVLENRTGRILADVGAFSYPLSQLNRATQSLRQPGSAIKPVTYLAALQAGLQPNTLLRDQPITLGPIGATISLDSEQDYWTPRNDSGTYGGVVTLRQGLEYSRNLATASLLEGGVDVFAEASLERICAVAKAAHIYDDCVKYYPFILGAQSVRPVNLAAFYAAIANEGVWHAPHAIDAIEKDGQVIYRHQAGPEPAVSAADRAHYVQLRSMLQGVLARGTGRAMASLSPYVAGKTGTTDGANDAWFVGFSNDVTVAVWVGYDNASGHRRTLGGGATGARVAIPIFEPVMRASWTRIAPRTVMRPPSTMAASRLVRQAIDLRNGSPAPQGDPNAFNEFMFRDSTGQVADTQYRLVSRDEMYMDDGLAGYGLFARGSLINPGFMRDLFGPSRSPYGTDDPYARTYRSDPAPPLPDFSDGRYGRRQPAPPDLPYGEQAAPGARPQGVIPRPYDEPGYARRRRRDPDYLGRGPYN